MIATQMAARSMNSRLLASMPPSYFVDEVWGRVRGQSQVGPGQGSMGPRSKSGSNHRENISSTPLHISGVRPVPTPLAQSLRAYSAVSRRISRITSVERNLKNENLYCL